MSGCKEYKLCNELVYSEWVGKVSEERFRGSMRVDGVANKDEYSKELVKIKLAEITAKR
jgi:hypothetical protein